CPPAAGRSPREASRSTPPAAGSPPARQPTHPAATGPHPSPPAPQPPQPRSTANMITRRGSRNPAPACHTPREPDAPSPAPQDFRLRTFEWTATADEILARVKIVQANVKKLVDNNAK